MYLPVVVDEPESGVGVIVKPSLGGAVSGELDVLSLLPVRISVAFSNENLSVLQKSYGVEFIAQVFC